MQRMLRNSSGSIAATGQTFWAMRLYLRTKVDGSAGRSDGKEGGVASSVAEGVGEGARLQTKITLTASTRPVQGHVERYTLHDRLAGSCTETSTLLEGRSSKQRRAAF